MLPLNGEAAVHTDDADFELAGRASVFAAVTDFVYVPRDAQVTITSDRGGRFALPSAARPSGDCRPGTCPRTDVPVELRGAGQASRQVNNFCAPRCSRPTGSSRSRCSPPAATGRPTRRTSTTRTPRRESELEEIYYFEIAPGGPAQAAGVGYQRVYTSGRGRDIDVPRRCGPATPC